MECRVEYDYTAQEEDELTLKKGDIISNVIQKMDGWWEGSLRGRKGMFPDNFVKLIEKSNQPPPKMETPKSDSNNSTNSNGVTLRNSAKSTRRLKALFSYAAEQEDELKLEMGDVIDFMQEVEEGWWMGKLKGRVGIFPSNFVTDYEASSNGKIENVRKLSDVSKPTSVKEEVVAIATDVAPAPPTTEPPPLDDEPAPVLPPKPVRELARCFYPYQAQNEDELTLNEGDVVTIISKNCEDEGWWRGEMKGKTGLFPDNFVKIIPANEATTVQVKRTASSASTTAAAKISPQERNLKGVIPISPTETSEPTLERKFSNTTVVDGLSSSKVQDKEARMSKVEATKAMFSKPFSFATGPKPPTPTSPSSGMSPMSMPVGLRRSNSNNKKDDDPSDEMGDFNSIEKGEKLNHLTASRAKPPKRRPPSTLIPRDNETSLTNGNHDSMDSPTMNNSYSTPFNSTFNSSASMNGTPSASLLETSSVSSSGGSFLSTQSKDGPSPVSGNTNGGTAKPKKLVPIPWMAELKQTQDKKKQTQGGSSPSSATPNSNVVNNSNPSGPAPSPSSLPTVPTSQISTKEPTPPPVVPAKAPPLPAKPSTLNTSSILTGSVDKSSIVSPSSATAPSIVHRGFGKKPSVSPMQPTSPVNNQFSTGYSMENTGSGDSKGTVSYEDYAILKDRVVHLEAELDTIKRQLKLLMDRDMSHGHIV